MQLEHYGEFPKSLPILVEEEMLLYPFMIAPLFIGNEESIKSIEVAMNSKDKLIFIAPSKSDEENEENDEVGFYDAGVIGTIMRRVALPEGRFKILFQGLSRGRLLSVESKDPLVGRVAPIMSLPYDEMRIEAVLSILKENLRTLYSVAQNFPQDLLKSINDTTDPNRAADLIASTLRLKKEQAYRVFKEENPEERLLHLIEITMEEIRAQQIQKEIKNKVNSQMEKVNKEYFLKEQLRQIQKELGGDSNKDNEIEEYRQKLEKLKNAMGKMAYKEVQKQINKLSRMHQDSADANLLQNYLEVVLEIPFGHYAKKDLEVNVVEKQLSKDHYALEKPKARIVEYFAVRKLLELRKANADGSKGAILCFYGPPGVGKTSLANSIATALRRKLVRIALGGLEDVNELRGHRRTYIGAMPGRIVQGLINAKEMNPVVVLDEIDKIHNSFRGDPSAVLLEILDPEQNKEFRDYYTNFSIDLSQVIFVATANDISAIPAPLRDRMEFININSYTPDQKEQIAKKYLIPQELKRHGLQSSEVNFSMSAIKVIIEKYTREAGVRNLRRKIAEILRKVAKEILEAQEQGKETEKSKMRKEIQTKSAKIQITPQTLPRYLDKIVFEFENASKVAEVGLINGLAWTSVGGDVLKIEALKIRGKGGLHLTGNLGDVMKESAKIAYSHIKSLIDNKSLKIDVRSIPRTKKEKEEGITPDVSEIYNRFDIHLHVPEGATPKDGPSAGIAIASALASLLTNQKVRGSVAMTGELTLRGKVLPIGGLQEKLIAAYKSGIKEVLIPKKNFERDLDEIPKEVKDGLNIYPVTSFKEVLAVLFK